MNGTVRSTHLRQSYPGETSAGPTSSIHTYAQLQEQIHRDLLAQHPEWIETDGNCPKCHEYDRRFAELISIFQSAQQAP